MSTVTEAKRSELKSIMNSITDDEIDAVYEQIQAVYKNFFPGLTWDEIMHKIHWRNYGRGGHNLNS